jgi:putative FmdB family regulatory protein
MGGKISLSRAQAVIILRPEEAVSIGLRSGGPQMPTYEYLCEKCGEQFTLTMSFSEYAAGKVTCPKCHSPEVKQQLSPFIAKTSRKA